MLPNAYLLAKIGVDTGENELSKVALNEGSGLPMSVAWGMVREAGVAWSMLHEA